MNVLLTWAPYLSPQRFYHLAGVGSRVLGWACLPLFVFGLYTALVEAPADYQQGDSFRILYVHVPSAWLSMFVYICMAGFGLLALVWRIKVAEILARNCAPLGASFTFLTLATGSLWGRPMWGTWWDWDPRLISELILLFLYFGYMALQAAIEDRRAAVRAGALLSLVGIVNIPIIHYSVVWWNSLHQGASISRLAMPAIHASMLPPLFLMALGFICYFGAALFARARYDLLIWESDQSWTRQIVRGET